MSNSCLPTIRKRGELFTEREIADVSRHSEKQARHWFSLFMQWIALSHTKPKTFVVVDNTLKCTLGNVWLDYHADCTVVFLCNLMSELTPFIRSRLDSCIMDNGFNRFVVFVDPHFVEHYLNDAASCHAMPTSSTSQEEEKKEEFVITPGDYDLTFQLFNQRHTVLPWTFVLLPEVGIIVEEYLFHEMLVEAHGLGGRISTFTTRWRCGAWYLNGVSGSIPFGPLGNYTTIFKFGTFHNGCVEVDPNDADSTIRWWYEQAYQSKYKTPSDSCYVRHLDFITNYFYGLRKQRYIAAAAAAGHKPFEWSSMTPCNE